MTSIGQFAFSCCSRLSSINIPDGVTSLDGTFHGCSSLTSISIPNSVTFIGNSTFEGCKSLTSITIPNGVTNISYYAFSECTSLTSVVIPNGVTSIPFAAFYNCTSLTSITIPSSITYIGESAFWGSGLTSIIIPSGITGIEKNSFQNCSQLTAIMVEEGNTVYDSRDNCNAIIETATNTLMVGCETTIIPNSVSTIGAEAFYGRVNLTSIMIPNSVNAIEDYAFEGCINLTSVTIPSSVTSIGKSFNMCNGLSTVTSLNPTPPHIDTYTFSPWPSILKVPAGHKEDYAAAEGWKKFANIEEIDPTDVKSVYSNKEKVDPIYNLNGHLLSAPQKGVNIIQGKKKWVK